LSEPHTHCPRHRIIIAFLDHEFRYEFFGGAISLGGSSNNLLHDGIVVGCYVRRVLSQLVGEATTAEADLFDGM
jgi:hypothetical protein